MIIIIELLMLFIIFDILLEKQINKLNDKNVIISTDIKTDFIEQFLKHK